MATNAPMPSDDQRDELRDGMKHLVIGPNRVEALAAEAIQSRAGRRRSRLPPGARPGTTCACSGMLSSRH